MIDLSVSFVGLELPTPIIIGSSGLSRNVKKAQEYVDMGAGAIILKSLFEEQINGEVASMSGAGDEYPEAMDYISTYVRSNEIGSYISLIKEMKSSISIPVIASINCLLDDSWVEFAREIEAAGADALEVNVMSLDTALDADPSKEEARYVSLIGTIVSKLKIPVIVKLSRYHYALPALVDRLKAAGAKAVTMFNRTYQVDIDIDNERISSADVLSTPRDFTDTLRFTALVHSLVPGIEISTSTGIHSSAEVIKAILAGADTTQICSVLYRYGSKTIKEILDGLRSWMQEHGYQSIAEMRGRLDYQKGSRAEAFERMQFMRYFSNRDN